MNSRLQNLLYALMFVTAFFILPALADGLIGGAP